MLSAKKSQKTNLNNVISIDVKTLQGLSTLFSKSEVKNVQYLKRES